MGVVNVEAAGRAVEVRSEGELRFLRLCRPETGNAIDARLIDELARALDEAQRAQARIVVLEGAPEVFCVGADFGAFDPARPAPAAEADPAALYELWRRLALGPFVSVALVRGKVNAGGVGFVAACDIVLAEEKAVFSLSEMLFGLLPACVMPFLVRRIGLARANALTLGTQPLPARQAEQWGLVDACEENAENLLRKHLLRLRRLARPAIERHKRYMGELDELIGRARGPAIRFNLEAFADPVNRAQIGRYVSTGRFPWEAGP